MKNVTLYRPVGQKEFELIRDSGFTVFPPRLEWQPIFYPVLNRQYAEQIAFEWNTKDEFSGYTGYVTAFDMPEAYLQKYPVQNVGGVIHEELWVAAEDLPEFNNNLIGKIRVLKAFYGESVMLQKIKGALLGLAAGDALGVPVEFSSRESLALSPVTSMKGYGVWNQPPGTWSDDSSLAFCTAESLAKGYDLDDMAKNFLQWLQSGFWGAHHKVFDVGAATRFAIGRISKGCSPLHSGGMMEDDNGNGSLMRIMPMLFYIKNLGEEERYQKISEVSSVTHAHFRSVFSCFIFLEMALQILAGNSATDAYQRMKESVVKFAAKNNFIEKELKLFDRVLNADIKSLPEDRIFSGGYVLHTLEASLYCLLTTDNYTDAVLKAVNLGWDTDTTACVTGAIAGLLYGVDNIPAEWKDIIARKDDIEKLCDRLNKQVAE